MSLYPLLACIGSMKWVKSVNISVLANIGACNSMESHTPFPPLIPIFSSHCAWVLRPPQISWEDLANMPVMGLLAGVGTITSSASMWRTTEPQSITFCSILQSVSWTNTALLFCHCFGIIPVSRLTATIKRAMHYVLTDTNPESLRRY
jgi:hypothetical protein